MIPRLPRGFTLIELLVTVAIITVLFALIAPALGEARAAGSRAVCGSNLRQVFGAFGVYMGDHDDTYPAADDQASPWLWMGRGFRSVLMPYISDGIDRDNPSILWCPSDTTEPAKYENTSYAWSMSFYHSPEQIDAMTGVASCYSNPVEAVGVQSQDVAWPAAKILVGEWFSNHRRCENENGWWCWEGSRVFAFADGHGEWLAAMSILPANDGMPDANLTVHGVKGMDR